MPIVRPSSPLLSSVEGPSSTETTLGSLTTNLSSEIVVPGVSHTDSSTRLQIYSEGGHPASVTLMGRHPVTTSEVTPTAELAENAESFLSLTNSSEQQSPGLDTDSVPLLGSKLAAKLKSIDGPVRLNLAASQGPLHLAPALIGDMGMAPRHMLSSSHLVLLARRPGSGRGGTPPPAK